MDVNSSPSVNDKRLYVGNLDKSINEYTLVKLCSKAGGRIVRLDYLFHKHGELKGQPRGYAFVEYANVQEATKCIERLNGKLFRGRKLVVTFATHSVYADQSRSQPSSSGIRKYNSEAKRPTALSILKSQNQFKNTDDKIAALEAKLATMQKSF